MFTIIGVKCRNTYVFNERGNTNPDAFIYVNAYDIFEAAATVKSCTSQRVVLVDIYPLRKKSKRYNTVPSWAV